MASIALWILAGFALAARSARVEDERFDMSLQVDNATIAGVRPRDILDDYQEEYYSAGGHLCWFGGKFNCAGAWKKGNDNACGREIRDWKLSCSPLAVCDDRPLPLDDRAWGESCRMTDDEMIKPQNVVQQYKLHAQLVYEQAQRMAEGKCRKDWNEMKGCARATTLITDSMKFLKTAEETREVQSIDGAERARLRELIDASFPLMASVAGAKGAAAVMFKEKLVKNGAGLFGAPDSPQGPNVVPSLTRIWAVLTDLFGTDESKSEHAARLIEEMPDRAVRNFQIPRSASCTDFEQVVGRFESQPDAAGAEQPALATLADEVKKNEVAVGQFWDTGSRDGLSAFIQTGGETANDVALGAVIIGLILVGIAAVVIVGAVIWALLVAAAALISALVVPFLIYAAIATLGCTVVGMYTKLEIGAICAAGAIAGPFYLIYLAFKPKGLLEINGTVSNSSMIGA